MEDNARMQLLWNRLCAIPMPLDYPPRVHRQIAGTTVDVHVQNVISLARVTLEDTGATPCAANWARTVMDIMQGDIK